MTMLRTHSGKLEPVRASRRRRPRRPELCIMRLEDRTLLSSGLSGVNSPPAAAIDAPVVNTAVTTDPGVQQSPSIAVDPLDSNHLAMAGIQRNPDTHELVSRSNRPAHPLSLSEPRFGPSAPESR